MQYDRLITGVAAVFAVLTGMLTVVGVLVNPAVLFLALMFGASAYFMYYHASGKLAADVYERVERRAAHGAQGQRGARRGGFGAGPREDWEGPRGGQRVREAARRARQAREQQRRRQQGRRRQRGRQQRRGGQGQRIQQSSGPSPSEAYARLDLDASADQGAVKEAYREKVKEVHPDTDTGSEAEFKRVKAAYETLTD
ncbi:J domain-containing protein [Halomicroarcula limicola]|uniref:J domain-containing protein n=1 Tax=Haloarcula limicola TaxID=1429915 RepID=A0A8J7YBJ2_9EURY|nr:J domain-containing protein [Halomicroarcula limicola]MBV0924859.1 J domain-containing protein [Halomicroarcula limicola]